MYPRTVWHEPRKSEVRELNGALRTHEAVSWGLFDKKNFGDESEKQYSEGHVLCRRLRDSNELLRQPGR